MPSNASAFSHMLMQILLLCRHPAADVPLGLVDVQHLARLRRERRIDLREALGDVLMYRTLADPEMLCRLPHGRVIVNDISGNLHGSFLNITFQTKTPAILVFTLYAEDLLLCMAFYLIYILFQITLFPCEYYCRSA